ncbi:MAG: ketosteroid isomerase-like protein [Enterobacterales bacterium]|jgi:ketosteroid isomerase-like protein
MKIILLSCLLLCSVSVFAKELKFNYEGFIKDYFSAWKNSQKPKAEKKDLEQYLAFLTDDIGYQHLPYSNDDSRNADGKKDMRKGMSYYLGIHTKYSAKLIKYSYGHNVIVLEFETAFEGIHPDNDQPISNTSKVIEVLEIEKGKVSVIRHYSD